ncbi:TonB-dependent receptor [Candidatus Electronema sp. TJ]|uniref:TonB-dependent receptor n=1 Tax=Candidatus Electronema sp. TJ TaxID=3401573 RepID=UPI003AA8958F
MKKNGRRIAKKISAAGIVCALSLSGGLAVADEAAQKEGGAYKLDEVIVTATKSETELKEVTASVTVLDGEQLRGTGSRVLTDALHQTAGLQMNEWEGGGEFSMVTMRGMPALNSQYVQVLVDGVPRNTALDTVDWSAIPMENVERVEIIKGPASALYGKSALGGVINIITKQGGASRQGEVSAGYGSHGENKQTALLSGPLDGGAGYSLGLTRRAGEGWRDENNDFDRVNGFARLDGQLAEYTKAGLSVDASTWELEYPDYLPLANYQAGEREQVFFKHGKEEHDEQNLGLSLEHELRKELKLVNRAYGQNITEEWRDIVDVVDKDLESRRMGDELRLISDNQLFSRKNQTMLGYQLESEDYDETRRFSKYFPAEAKRGLTSRDAESNRLFNSLYVQDELKVRDDITATAGLRYDHIAIELDNLLDPAGSRDSDFSEFSPKVGAAWAVNPALSLFASLSSGFKAPVGSQIASNPDIEPEDALSYETGLKASLLGGRAYVQLSLYRTDLENQLVMVPDAAAQGTFRYENAGESRMQGVELEGDLDLGHGFTLAGSYTYNDSSYVDFVDYEMDYSDNDLPWQPKHKTALELRYGHSCGFGASLASRWVGTQWIDNENSFEQDSYNLVDAKLTYTKGQWEGSLSVRNLFDSDYIAAGENWGGGDIYLTPGDPLTFYAELKLRF